MGCRVCVSWVQIRVSSILRGVHTITSRTASSNFVLSFHSDWEIFLHSIKQKYCWLLPPICVLVCASCIWDGNFILFFAKSVRTVHVHPTFWGGKKHRDQASFFIPWSSKKKSRKYLVEEVFRFSFQMGSVTLLILHTFLPGGYLFCEAGTSNAMYVHSSCRRHTWNPHKYSPKTALGLKQMKVNVGLTIT